MNKYKELIILIAEDDDGHAELIREGLVESGITNTIIRFANGLQIWEFLSSNSDGNKQNPAKNYLLLLDINMPLMDGVEVLTRIKSDDNLKELPVVMLTTTDDPKEVEMCYKIGCNFYIIKPVNFNKFTDTLKQLGLFIQILTI